jgi:hypothetical protein
MEPLEWETESRQYGEDDGAERRRWKSKKQSEGHADINPTSPNGGKITQRYFAKTDPGTFLLANDIKNKYLPTVEEILESVLSEKGSAMKVSDPAGFATVDPSAEHMV